MPSSRLRTWAREKLPWTQLAPFCPLTILAFRDLRNLKDERVNVRQERAYALMLAILLRMAWLDAFDRDAKAMCPGRTIRRLAETEGFEPSIGLYNPITV